MTIQHAPEPYQVPKSTLPDHLSGCGACGANTKYLSDLEKEELANLLIGSGMHTPRSRFACRETVGRLA